MYNDKNGEKKNFWAEKRSIDLTGGLRGKCQQMHSLEHAIATIEIIEKETEQSWPTTRSIHNLIYNCPYLDF